MKLTYLILSFLLLTQSCKAQSSQSDITEPVYKSYEHMNGGNIEMAIDQIHSTAVELTSKEVLSKHIENMLKSENPKVFYDSVQDL